MALGNIPLGGTLRGVPVLVCSMAESQTYRKSANFAPITSRRTGKRSES
jgi:hypothetical protein